MAELKGGDGRIALVGRVLDSELAGLRVDFERCIEERRGKDLIMDLQDLDSGGSHVLSLLLCGMRKSERESCKLAFSGMPQGLFDMARVGGIESLLPFEDVN